MRRGAETQVPVDLRVPARPIHGGLPDARYVARPPPGLSAWNWYRGFVACEHCLFLFTWKILPATVNQHRLFGLFFCFILMVFGGGNAGTARAQPYLDLGVTAGGYSTEITGNRVVDPASLLRPRAGVFVELRNDTPAALRLEAKYARKGVSALYFSERFTTEFDFLQLDLLARLRLRQGRVEPSLIGGFFTGFFLGSSVSPAQDPPFSPLLRPEGTTRSADWGYTFGAELRSRVQGGELILGARIERGAESIFNSRFKQAVAKTRAIGIAVGYVFW